ncbi:MAG: TraB/GumN family protein [Steroidobacteraceae bacterium]
MRSAARALLSLIVLPILALAPISALAEQDTPTLEETIEEITIVGERAGPGLWKVRNGDNTLYLLGTLSPLPKKLEWRSREVESVLGRAQLLIPARGDVSADIGPVRAVRLYMQYRRLRDNDNDARLDAVLPPELFARFEALRKKYAPRERSLLERRPVLAAGELWREALSRSGLTARNDINRTVEKLAKARKVPIRRPALRVDDPQGTLAEVAEIPRAAEIACMAATLNRLESDLAAARARAQAWSVGDVAALRSPASAEQQDVCWSALQQSPKIAALRTQFDEAWFRLALEGLETHPVTLAVVPIDELYKRRGVLERMRERGYRVEEP